MLERYLACDPKTGCLWINYYSNGMTCYYRLGGDSTNYIETSRDTLEELTLFDKKYGYQVITDPDEIDRRLAMYELIS